jgi:hypothetical protein
MTSDQFVKAQLDGMKAALDEGRKARLDGLPEPEFRSTPENEFQAFRWFGWCEENRELAHMEFEQIMADTFAKDQKRVR